MLDELFELFEFLAVFSDYSLEWVGELWEHGVQELGFMFSEFFELFELFGFLAMFSNYSLEWVRNLWEHGVQDLGCMFSDFFDYLNYLSF